MTARVRDATIAMTGGAGFVGAALAERFARDNRVRVLDLGVHGPPSGLPANVEVTTGDVRDPAAVDELTAGADIVIHLASIAGVRSVLTNPVATMETALIGARNVLDAARRSPELKRVILFSTSEVAGRFAYNVQEDATLAGARVDELRWTYAAAKLASEFSAAAYHFEYATPTVALRPFNIYGPGQLGSGAIREFVRRAVTGEPLEVRGDGAQIRAWCFIEDIVDAVDLVCRKDAAVGKVFNVGNPRSVVTVSELAKLVVRLANSASEVRYVPTNEVDVELRVPDITRARELLGFEPKIDLDDGLLQTIAWFREQHGEG
jgi:nucleoside-diphosphate-sugar epimerase